MSYSSSQSGTSPSTPTKNKPPDMAQRMLMPKSNRQFEKIKQALTSKQRENKKRAKRDGETQQFEM